MILSIQSAIQNFRGIGAITTVLISLFVHQSSSAQTANPDMAITDSYVLSAIIQGDYTYIGGSFTFAGKNSGYCAKVTTTNSSINKLYSKVNGAIYACIPDGANGWYIGGNFSAVGDASISYLARIKQDGTLDATWNPQPANIVYSLALSGTDLFAGGSFTSVGGSSRNRIAKISTVTGIVDPDWNPGANNYVRALLVYDGWLFAAGDFTLISSLVRNRLAKLPLTGTGTADATWDPNSNATVLTLAASGTDLFVGGNFTTIGGISRNKIAKISTSGSGTVDGVWNPNSSGTINSLVVSGSELFAGGNFTTIGGLGRNYCAKLSVTGEGTADALWDPGLNTMVFSIALSGSDVFIGGSFATAKGGTVVRNRVAKFSATGTGEIDTDWDPSVSDVVYSIAINGSDIYMGGAFKAANGYKRNRLARINNLTGEVDPSWDPDLSGPVNALASDGSFVYAGGDFTTVNQNSSPQSMNRLARFSISGNGAVDATWNPNIGNIVYSLLISGSQIYVGGNFTIVNGSVSMIRLARFTLSSPANVDASWVPNCGGPVNALAIGGSFLYAGGQFTTVNSPPVSRNRLARFPVSSPATVDGNWDPNINSTVNTLAISGSVIYVGGNFTSVGSSATPRNRLARFTLSSPASVDSWNPDVNLYVYSLALSGTDIYVGGGYSTVNGSTVRNGLSRISTSTGLADSWNPNSYGAVRTIALSGTDLYAGGQFSAMGGVYRSCFALFTDRTLPVELVSFTSSVAGGVVTLNWQTATEVDNSGFEVQRAVVGSDNWTKLGFVDGHHTTNSPRYYSFRDQPSKTEGSKFRYRLKQIDNSGKFEYSNTIEVDLGSPVKFSLEQNYPNPFNPATVIRYQLPVPGNVTIDLYSVSGEKITTLLSETKESGSHSFTFDATQYGLSSGIYFYRMTVITSSGEVFSSTRKLSLIK